MGTKTIKVKTIADIKDVEELSKLKHESLSRGKKQRIVKKIREMTG